MTPLLSAYLRLRPCQLSSIIRSVIADETVLLQASIVSAGTGAEETALTQRYPLPSSRLAHFIPWLPVALLLAGCVPPQAPDPEKQCPRDTRLGGAIGRRIEAASLEVFAEVVFQMLDTLSRNHKC